MADVQNTDDRTTVTASRRNHDIRKWRIRALIGGQERPETPIIRASWTRTRYTKTDTASITMAVDRVKLAQAGAKWFDPQDPAKGLPEIKVIIQVRDESLKGAEWQTMFSGFVNTIDYNPFTAQVSVACRDLISKIMDMSVRQQWVNQTGQEVVKDIITRAGVTPVVQFPSGMTGAYWMVEHARTPDITHSRFQTGYDVARFIANEFNCDLYAEDDKIYCLPRKKPTDDDAAIHTLRYAAPSPASPIRSSALTMQLSRDLLATKNLVVHVMSWDSRQRATSETYFSAEGKFKTPSEDHGIMYTYMIPGLKQSQVENEAQRIYNSVVAHNRRIEATMPANVKVQPRTFMNVTGTGTSWDSAGDEAYTVDSTDFYFTDQCAFTQRLTLRNRDASVGSNTDAE